MNLLKIAARIEQKLTSLAYSQMYQVLAELHDKAVGLTADTYSEMNPSVKSAVEDLAKSVAIIADKAWRAGVTADELAMWLERSKPKTLRASMALASFPDGDVQDKFDSFMSTYQMVRPVDIDVQSDVGLGYKAEPEMKEEPNSSELPYAYKEQIDSEYQGEDPVELGKVVDQLMEEKYTRNIPAEGL